jgi:hypothetical protein
MPVVKEKLRKLINALSLTKSV